MTKLILTLLCAIHGVESSYSRNQRMGDDGPLQITSVCLKDVNRICRKNGCKIRFKPEDRKDLGKSREIALVYLSYWGPLCAEKYGKPMDEELLARLWHRGPTRMYDEYGNRYWENVKKELNALKGKHK